MFRFFLLVSVVALLLYVAVRAGADQGWFHYPSYSDEIVLFLALSHLGLFYLILRQLGQRPEDFVKVYLGSTVLRILFFGLFIFLIIRLDPGSAVGNALCFLVCYFIFTALEVSMLYVAVTNQKPPRTGQKGP